MPRKFPHERKESESEEAGEEKDEELPEEKEEQSEESNDPVEAIFAIINKYYKGLKREEEGMGVD